MSHANESLALLETAINALYKEVVFTWKHLRTWRDMQAFFSDRTDLTERWIGAVNITLKAHLESTVLGFSRLLENPSQSSGVNVEYFLNLALLNRRNCSRANFREVIRLVDEDKAFLAELRDELVALRRWRDNIIAHLDKKEIRSPGVYSVSSGVLRGSLQALHIMLNKYAGLFFDLHLCAGSSGDGDFGKMALALELGDRTRREMIKAAEESATDPSQDPFEGIPQPLEAPTEWQWRD